jgi:hypothetical protein
MKTDNLIPVPFNPHGTRVPASVIDSDLSYYDEREKDAVLSGDAFAWKAEWVLEKYNAPSDLVRAGAVAPDEVIHRKGNLLTYGGVDLLINGFTSTGAIIATTGVKNTVFNNANAVIYVGDSNTAAAASQTDLQATSESTNRDAVGMEATYPLHTTGDNSTANQDVTFRSVFSTLVGNFAWEEWAIGNTTATTAPYKGRILNRKVEALGTKTAAATWTFTCKISIA